MKKKGIIMALVVALCVAVFTAPAICEALTLDEATQEYIISTPQDLIDFRDMVNGGEYEADARLEGNIDLTQTDGTPLAWEPIGFGSSSSNAYKGTFDGKDFRITGYEVTAAVQASSNASTAGFFGALGNGAVIKNLTVDGDINITATNERGYFYVGGIVGVIYSNATNATIENCANSGDVIVDLDNTTYTYIGGIVGSALGNGAPSIKDCINSGTVKSTIDAKISSGLDANYTGGIVGKLETGSVSGCMNTAANTMLDVNRKDSSGASHTYAGGIAGYAGDSCEVTDCTNTSAVSSNCIRDGGSGGGRAGAGGIVGENDEAIVSNCANSGNVSSTRPRGGSGNPSIMAGGIVGDNGGATAGTDGGTISSCANTGSVSIDGYGNPKAAGSIAGTKGENATVENCVVAEGTGSVVGSDEGAGGGTSEDGATSISEEQASEIVTAIAFTASEFEVAEGETAVITLDTFPGSTSQFDSYVKEIAVSIEPSTAAELVSQEGKNITIRGLAAGETATVKITAKLYSTDFSNASELQPSADYRDVTAQCALTVASSSTPDPTPSTPQHSGGGGGGCSAGFGALALLAVVPLLRMRKK